MSRVTESILSGQAYADNTRGPMLDLSYGGQNGWMPNLKEWVSNQAYVQGNVIPFLIEPPKFFQYMPNPDKMVQILKALIETHTVSIEGLNAALTAEFAEHAVGGSGEMQKEVTDVKRTRTEVVHTFQEKYGRPIQRFLEYYMHYAMMDPDTKHPNIFTLENAPDDWLADQYTFTVMYVEPDVTLKKPVKAWLVTNMMPDTTGDITGKRNLTEAKSVLDLSVNFGGIALSNWGVLQTAQSILDKVNFVNSNPYSRPAFVSEIQSDVEAATTGFTDDVNAASQEAVQP